MSGNVDLNRLREMVIQNQQTNNERPSEQNKKVFVDRDGNIREGRNTSSNEAGLSEVPQATFASSRLVEETNYARSHMPRNTRKFVTDEGVTGWVYEFDSEFKDNYCMFAYFDGSYYQVLVIQPKVEGKWNSAHTGHIFSDGRICFGSNYNSGMPTLKDAYAKSVLWANGLSVATRTDFFPFSANQ